MDSEFRMWQQERKRADTMARSVQAPSSSTPTITSAVAVPALQALLVGAAVGILTGGLAGLFGAGLLLAGKVALAGLLCGWAGTTVAFVFQERSIRSTPALVARAKLALAEPSTPPPETDAEPWRVIRPYAPRPALAAATYQQEVRTIEPDVRPEVRELHQFICDCWDGGTGNLARAACRDRGYGRATWERLVGGKRGKAGESARGILDRAGVAVKDGTGWQWRDGVTLQDVFNITPALLEYAHSRSQMVTGRRDRTDGTGQDAPVSTSQRPGAE